MHAIELQNIKLRFPKSDFLLDLPQLQIPEGYLTGFIGENGAGKTTTIKLIMNMLLPAGGTVKIFEKDNSDPTIRGNIGYVGDQMGYMEEASLKATIAMVRPFYPNWDDQGFHNMLHRFGLTDLRQKYKALSQGRRKQFALAIALAHHPRLLLLDEPTANLDPLIRNEILTILSRRLEEEKLTVLFSTHITSDLDKIADFLLFIHNGKPLLSGAKDALLEQHRIVKGKKEQLNPSVRQLLTGVEEMEYGFRGLCKDYPALYRQLGDQAVYEKASVEDIFLGYTERRDEVEVW